MQVQVLYFGIVKERLGLSDESFDVESGATVSGLLDLLKTRHPDFAEGVDSVRIAVNEEYVKNDHVLEDEDEVAVIPPVSGGR